MSLLRYVQRKEGLCQWSMLTTEYSSFLIFCFCLCLLQSDNLGMESVEEVASAYMMVHGQLFGHLQVSVINKVTPPIVSRYLLRIEASPYLICSAWSMDASRYKEAYGCVQIAIWTKLDLFGVYSIVRTLQERGGRQQWESKEECWSGALQRGWTFLHGWPIGYVNSFATVTAGGAELDPRKRPKTWNLAQNGFDEYTSNYTHDDPYIVIL